MLSVVLLHMVESPGPIHRAFHFLGGPGPRVHQVKNVTIALLGIENRSRAQGPAVSGLAASLGVEGGLVQNNRQLALELKRAKNSGAKAGQVGVS